MAKTKSILLFLLAWGVVVFLASLVAIEKTSYAKPVVLTLGMLLWPPIWLALVKPVPFQEFRYYLPDSRLVGYLIYLVLPVGTIITLLFAAAYFGVGV